jgi:hypothetical protein
MKNIQKAQDKAKAVYSGWIRVFSGGKFRPADPRAEDIRITDIAHALSNLCRYTGHCSVYFSVAQHSCLVSDVLPAQYKLWGLLHDASEAYTGDLAAPTKVLPEMAAFRHMEDNIMAEVIRRFRLSPLAEPLAVKLADKAVLLAEAAALGMHPETWGIDYVEPAKVEVRPWPPEKAEFEFLRRYCELTRDA